MAKTKLWNSKAWLYRQRIVNRLSVPEIAKLAKCAESTIYAKLKEHGIR